MIAQPLALVRINVLQTLANAGTRKAVGFAKSGNNLRLGFDDRLCRKPAVYAFGLFIGIVSRQGSLVTAKSVCHTE